MTSTSARLGAEDHPAADGPRPPALELHGAAVTVGGRTLWRDVDLSVGAREFVAILGPNGVGKSTLVKAALGVMALSAGHVRLFGDTPARQRHRVGYLPQRRSFDPSLRIRGVDLVRLGLDGDRWGVPVPLVHRRGRADQDRRLREVIELVGASAYADRPIGVTSGGEQQRLLIAQALARRPELLLLDEPLDSLDLPNQGSIAALLSQICREHGVSVVIVAHDVNPILPYLDRVVYIGAGGVAAGVPEDVITGPVLSRLYGVPIEVLRTSDGRLVVVGQPEAPAHHHDRHT